MALINRRERQLALGAAGVAAGDTLVRLTVQELGKLLRESRVGTAPAPQAVTRPKHKRQPKRKPKQNPTSTVGGPMRPLTRSEKNSITIKGTNIISLLNSGIAGALNGIMQLSLGAASQTSGWSTLATSSNKLIQFRGMYRHFRLLNLRVSFEPSVTDSTAGVFAMAFDAETIPESNAGNTINAIYQKEIASVAHIRSPSSITWKPYSAKDREERFTTNQPSRTADELSYGALLFLSENSAPASSAIGYLKVDYTIAFDEEVI